MSMSELKQTAFRLPPVLLKRLDKFAKRRTAETGMAMNRTDAVRLLLTKALEQEERGRRV
jgi:predicted DNA-binding protein